MSDLKPTSSDSARAAEGQQDGSPVDRVPNGQDSRSDQAAASNAPSLASRVASSASNLARDVFAPDRQSAASTLSHGLQSAGKAGDSAQAASSSTAAASVAFTHGSQSTTKPASGAAIGLQESFRSNTREQLPDLSEMNASPFLDDARNSVYGSYPESMYEQWASTSKGKARQSSSDTGFDWTREFRGSPQLQRANVTDVDRIYGSSTDGADVLGILDNPTFNLETSTEQELLQPEPSANDLFGDGVAEQQSAMLAQGSEKSRLFPSNADILADMTGLRSSADGADAANATGSWLSAWSDVLENYTDYVWSPEEKQAIEEAREEIGKLKDAPNQEEDEGASQTVRRLRQILGHLNPKAVARSRASVPNSSRTADHPHPVGEVLRTQIPHQKREANGRRESIGASRSPSPESWD